MNKKIDNADQAKESKNKITLELDESTILYFKSEANKTGAHYSTLISNFLEEYASNGSR